MLIQIVEANATLEPTLDSRKSDEADKVVVVTTSRWPGLLLFLIVIILFLLSCLLLRFTVPEMLLKFFSNS
jgi:hypothetical protein